ncbi:hypothetical protein ACP_3301 [Acidobacterium capsulatum ATCC 51196]|uniref:Uncharacterized protein n=1 Tax=Acidobacterium capsulatum (strain ATCC 51196 / DSM 11244 / BCRC 80197 / JCM 7670 / NBRC 15755 / NCIMB 13165 / 161) TaxID=240015 RepID=C1F671_ACIC5|nr:hypothetical protein ACP_3301 [Acidobacterium capsulatum ATCC 51196]
MTYQCNGRRHEDSSGPGICFGAQLEDEAVEIDDIVFMGTTPRLRAMHFLHFSAYKCTSNVSCFGRLFALSGRLI